jgi:hypothetical protein
VVYTLAPRSCWPDLEVAIVTANDREVVRHLCCSDQLSPLTDGQRPVETGGSELVDVAIRLVRSAGTKMSMSAARFDRELTPSADLLAPQVMWASADTPGR